MLRRSILVLGLAIGCLIPASARAESIPSFNSEITLNSDGLARFTELIDYDLSSGKHGISRDIPVVGDLNNGTYLYYAFSQPVVLRNGQPEQFTQNSNGIYQRLKIGNPNRTISGLQKYQIDFSLSPMVRHDPAGDYITLNITGNEWEVGIDQAQASIVLPEGIIPKSSQCFTGPKGSTDHDCTIQTVNNKLTVELDLSLASRQGMTVDIVVPANSFSSAAYLEPSNKAPSVKLDSTSLLAGLMWVAITGSGSLIMLLIVYKYFTTSRRKKRLQKQQTIVPYYDPPDKLSPGEIGLLSDDISTTVEITATIIQLASRGHLKIAYEEKKQLFGSKKRFLLTSQKTSDKLQDYEEVLLDGIFKDRQLGDEKSIHIDELSPITMSDVVNKFNEMLASRLKTKGFYLDKANWSEYTTKAGYEEWAKVQGLKLYLSVAEKDRMKFAEAPDKTPARFTKLLPYAIALGVEKDWAKQFEGIDVSPATSGWYSGSPMTDAGLFTSVMSSSFANSVSSNVSPPSSSGGSGGGFSGGGGGGGGGGSW